LNKWIKRSAVILGVLAAGELVWLLVISPFMPLNNITVEGVSSADQGAGTLSREAVLEVAGVSDSSSYMNVDVEKVKAAVESLYQVADAIVAKQYPGSLRIVLKLRKPVAQAIARQGELCVPVLIDRDGVIVCIGSQGIDSIDGNSASEIPLVSGLNLKNVVLGQRLPPLYNVLFARLEELETKNPQILVAISEIFINKKEYGGFDLVVYPVYYRLKFRLQSTLDEDTLKYMVLMMDVFEKNKVAAQEIDLRGGTAAYTAEAANG
jgi:cell division protein FtsQ